MEKRTFAYGRKKDTPDARDHKFRLPRLKPIHTVYLNPDNGYKMPPVWDQGNIGSCTSMAWSFAFMFDMMNRNSDNNTTPDYVPAPLFIYYKERELIGQLPDDSGAALRDGAATLKRYGVCDQKYWPYVPSTFNFPPSPDALADALNHRAVWYQSLDNTNKELLVNTLMLGFPIVFGMDCYESFQSDFVNNTSIVPYPGVHEKFVGGHAMCVVGYHMGEGDEDTFIVRNSWGTEWGSHGGYLRIPTRYLCNPHMAGDFWVLNTVS